MTHAQHDLDIYPVRLHLVTTRKQWRKHHAEIPLHQESAPDSAGQVQTTLDRHSGRLHVTVWIAGRWHREHGNDLRETVVHEAVHAGGAILDHVGQTYNGESEALAYLVDWIARWLQSSLDARG